MAPTGEARLVVVSGKGGTGKSAVAAATAIAAQREGAKVLAIAMAGSGAGLSTHLGSPPLEFAPQEVRPGLFALVIDRSKALVEYLSTQMGIPAVALFGPALRAFDALASAAPAVREIITIGKVLYEVRRGGWDLVVADGPPTGQVGSYLRAAHTITELVPSGRIRDQAGWMEALLLDPQRSDLVLVTLPEELPTHETGEMLEWLLREQVVGRVTVAANRVLPELEAPEGELPGGSAGDAARLHLSLQAEQQRWLQVLPPHHQLPFLFGLMTPTEVAARLADEVERW